MSSPKYSQDELRAMARHVLAQRDAGDPRYEVFLFMLMMRLCTFDRSSIELRIKELAQ